MATKKTSDKKGASGKKAPSKKTSTKKRTSVAVETAAQDTSTKASRPRVARRPLMAKTFYPKQSELSQWVLIDAKGMTLGRLSSQVANILMGKSKAGYTRFADTGDFVIVINAKEVVLTGNKWADKRYYYHTNYPGGIKTFTAQELLNKTPERLVERAVHGMLPEGHMARRWFRKLRVFAGAEHPHAAQKPKQITLAN